MSLLKFYSKKILIFGTVIKAIKQVLVIQNHERIIIVDINSAPISK